MAIVLIAIGLLFTGIDIYWETGIFYPAFSIPLEDFYGVEIKEGIQGYVNQNILGETVRVDLLPDVLGCLLIMAGVILLIKHNKRYISGLLLELVPVYFLFCFARCPLLLMAGPE